MKKFLLGSMALAAMLAGPAMAADMPVKVKAPPPVVVYDWSGAYIGFSIGGVWTDVKRTYPLLVPALEATSHDDDVIYDFHAGAQWQWGQWVLGAEAGYSAGFKEMRSTVALPAPPFVADLSAYNKMTNLFTVGPRLGFAWDRWMIYGTGGYAVATVHGQYVFNGLQVFPPGINLTGHTWNHGWFAGAGFEYMVYKGPLVDVILGAEYQHFDVEDKRAATIPPFFINDVLRDFSFDHGAKGDIVRARLTIKTQGYGWWGTP